MGNSVFTKDRGVCVKPLRSRLELQKLLKPKYDWTGKGRQFIWGEEQQILFNEIRRGLQ